MKRRYTVQTLSAGQTAPYGPTVYRHRITYEWQDMAGFKNTDAPFVPHEGLSEDAIRRDAKHFSGWEDEGQGDWASTRLKYLRKVGTATWEWETSAAYTD